jgi:cytokinin dehydrogenase
LRYGSTPPVLPDYLGLTVGGTLAAGGIGGTSHLYGPQVDQVHELEVVTPGGEVVSCSPAVYPRLFYAVLGGHGQSGIITRATIPLVPAPQRARVRTMRVPSLATFIACQSRLARERRFGSLAGQIAIGESGGWEYTLESASYYSGSAAEEGVLPGGLAPDEVTDLGYEEFCHRMAEGVRLLAATGDWYRPHPWLSVFLPVSHVGQYVSDALAMLTPDTTGPIPLLLCPLRRGPGPAPGLATPDGDRDGLFYSFVIPRTVPGTEQAIGDALRSNGELAERAIAGGGSVHAISALPTG